MNCYRRLLCMFLIVTISFSCVWDAQAEASAKSKITIFNQHCTKKGACEKDDTCKIKLDGSYMCYGGCLIWSYIHAIQWCQDEKINIDTCIAMIKKFIAEFDAPWSGDAHDPYKKLAKSYGLKVEKNNSVSKSDLDAVKSHFADGGVLVCNWKTDSSGHYSIAVGHTKFDYDKDGTKEDMIHIVDSAAWWPIYNKAFATYDFNTFEKITKRPSGGGEYWIPYSTFKDRAGIVGVFLPSYSPVDSIPRIAKSVKTKTDNAKDDQCYIKAEPYEKSATKDIADKGKIIYLSGSVKNSGGNLWYKTEDGYYIYTKDLEILVEDASYTETKFGAVGVSKNNECWLKEKPFENAAPEKVGVAKGKPVEIVAKVTNSYGNIWYKTEDGKYIYSGDLKVYEASYTKLFDITADFTNKERRKSRVTPYQDSPAVDSYSKGEVVSVTRFVTNSYGNIWARLTDGSYLCFYDCEADETKMTYKSSKFNVTGVEGPTGDRKTGTACKLTGKITSAVPILTMTGYVENRETGAKTVPAVVVKMKNGTTTANINSTSNTVDKVNLNKELEFQKIQSAGHYCYKVTLQLGFTDTKSGQTFKLGGEQVVVSMNFTAGNPPAMKEKVVRGDVNDDGKINLTDLLQLLRHINNSSVSVNKSNADMNGDGKVALLDLLLLLRKIND